MMLLKRKADSLSHTETLLETPHSGSASSQVALVVKKPPASAGDVREASLIPGLGRGPGGGHGNPFQYSCLENPMDRDAWQVLVGRVTRSCTQLKWLSTHAFKFFTVPTRPCGSRLCHPFSPISCYVFLKTTCSSCILSFGFWNTANFVAPLDVLLDILFSLSECMYFHCLGVAGSSSCRFQLKTSWSSNILLWPYLCKQVFHDLSFSISVSCLHLSLTL